MQLNFILHEKTKRKVNLFWVLSHRCLKVSQYEKSLFKSTLIKKHISRYNRYKSNRKLIYQNGSVK